MGSSRKARPFTESLRARFEPHACAQKCSQKSVFIKTCTLNMHFPSVASRGESSQNVCFPLGLQQMEQQAQSSKEQAQSRKKSLRHGKQSASRGKSQHVASKNASKVAWKQPEAQGKAAKNGESKQNRVETQVELKPRWCRHFRCCGRLGLQLRRA